MEEGSIEAEKTRVPASMLMLFVSLCVFALSAFPPTGIFLMLFGAPLWSMLLINSAFLLTFFDVFYRGLSKVLLLLPAIYFGGYGAATLLSHLGGDRYVVSAKIGSSIPPLELNRTLAINGRFEIDMESFLATYDLNELVYQGQHAEGVVDGRCSVYGHHLLPGPKCIVYDFGGGPKPDMLVSASWGALKDKGPFYYKSYDFDWTVTKGDVSQHVVGRLRTPLTWFPLPIAGCLLSDQSSAWVCKFQFTFEDDVFFLDPFASNSWNMALAHVTGVRPRS